MISSIYFPSFRQVGLDALKAGGNAVDAVVAAAFCQGVVSPAHSGLGGGGFAIVHDHKFMNSYGYDFRETAPFAATPDMLAGKSGQDILASGVPGQLKGLAALHKQHGQLPWKDLVEPSVHLAREFAVSKAMEVEVLQKFSPD